MGFFKDFKEDFSQAVTDLVTEEPGLENTQAQDDIMINTLDDPELAQMAASFEKQAMAEMESATENLSAEVTETIELKEEVENRMSEIEESEVMSDTDEEIIDETAVITKGLSVTGDLDSKGSIDIFGSVEGNVACRGKLTVSGVIVGDSKANEVFANNAQIDGNIETKGSVKIGQGSVIVGNVSATSAVIAGAVKGDIDVHGPVIIDASAIIVGDIKSKSVQINNGATIDGRCSQCYADVNTVSIFEKAARNSK